MGADGRVGVDGRVAFSKRIQFRIQDLLDLCHNGWQEKRVKEQVTKPRTRPENLLRRRSSLDEEGCPPGTCLAPCG